MDDETAAYGLNVGAFIDRYRPLGWMLRGVAAGFVAQLLDDAGRPLGRPLSAPTLDELAARIEAGP